MLECEEPDKFSIVTYVSQFYHLLKVRHGRHALFTLFTDKDLKRLFSILVFIRIHTTPYLNYSFELTYDEEKHVNTYIKYFGPSSTKH